VRPLGDRGAPERNRSNAPAGRCERLANAANETFSRVEASEAELRVVLLTERLPAERAALPVRGTASRRAGGTSVASLTAAR
jgi:hypothetical protein